MDSNIIFNNNFVKQKFNEYKESKKNNIIQELQKSYPLLDSELLLSIYEKSISIHQSIKQNNGNYLEKEIIAKELDRNNIKYKQQVIIDNKGIIIDTRKKQKCFHIIDFVIGNNIKFNTSITKYKVVSCKTSCRERWTQDNWTLQFNPIKYILVTISNDYPSSNRFTENLQRKIITCTSKVKDDRLYKLSFEDLIKELNQ